VGATEMSTEDAERVAELTRELEEVKAKLAQVHSENAQLRERFGNAAWISASSTD
jgi:molecular chaperone GrpE (heat shock protein)